MNTAELIMAQFPGRVLIPLIAAGKSIGYAEQTSYNLHHKGKFPLRVRMQGRKPMVALTDLVKYMTEEGTPDPTAAPPPAAGQVRRGRKRNSEIYG